MVKEQTISGASRSRVQEDEYHFQLGELTVAQKQERIASATNAESQSKDWMKYADSKKLPAEGKLKKLVRLGIPPEHRPWVWPEVSGAKELQASNPSSYFKNMVTAGRQKSNSIKQIELDLPRTFPHNSWLQSEQGQQALEAVLIAYSMHNAKVGYCQGLNNVAGLLLLALGKQPETAFWVLVALVDRILCASTYSRDLEGCHVEMRTLEALVAEKMPRLYRHLQALPCEVSLLATEWFLCLFATSLPPLTAVRVWDALLNEGPKVLHRVSLALLQMHEGLLLTMDNTGELMHALKQGAAGVHQRDLLMSTAFNKVGGLPMAKVNKLRTESAIAVAAMLQEREAARKRQELKDRIREGRKLQEQEVERRIDDEVPDLTPLDEVRIAARDALVEGAKTVTAGVGVLAQKTKEAASKVAMAAAAGAANIRSPGSRRRTTSEDEGQ